MRNLLLTLLLTAAAAFGQSTAGEIAGTVTDPTGAAVPGVQITFLNENTGEVKIVETGATGDYLATQMQVGTYMASVQSEGFRTVERPGIALSALQSLRVDFVLELGQLTETVTITSQAPQVDTRSTQIGMTVDDRRIKDLPLNGRNPLDLVRLVPGVQRVSTTIRPSFGQQNMNINGGRHFSVNYLLDGGSMSYFHRGQGLILPPPDAVQEFRVSTTGVTAEHGRGFSVISAVTRSGTNQFHGSLWHFLRNDALDARNFFSRTVPKLRFNQFGGTVGGPVIKDKSFFQFTYQGQRIREDRLRNAFPATRDERAGIFTGADQIKNADTGDLFPNNIVPANLLDPVAQFMLDGWVPFPEEHRGDGSFVTQVSQPSDDNQYLTRFDHNITDRNKINFRLFYDHNEGADPLRNADFINYGPNPRFNRMQTYTLEDTHLITPTLVNTIRLTYTRFNYQESIPFDDDLADFGATHFNHAGGVVKSRPLVQITNRFRLGPGRHRQRLSQNYALSWNMSLLKGNHNMKWGLDTQRNQFLYRDNRATGSEWQFTGNRTGLPMADFVTGKARRVRQASPIEFDHRYIQSGIFFQDSFKVHRNITMTLGVRNEFFPRWEEQQNQQTALVPGAQSSFIGEAPAGLIWLSDGDFPYQDALFNIAPRFGIAWDLFGDGRTSLRTSYGISYDPLTAEMAGGVQALQPFGASVDINQPAALSAPFLGHFNPFPFVFNPDDPNFVFPITIPKGFAPGLRNPYMQTYNLTIQQQVSDNMMVEVAYVGNLGRNLTYNRQQNMAIFGEGATARNTDARRIHQGFGSIGQLNSGASSVYNSLQVQVQRRFSRGLTFQVAYTYGRAIDEVLTSSAFATVTQNGLQDPNNRDAERGRGDFDIQQRMVSSFLYEIPAPKATGLRHVLGGWELGSILTFQEGRPFHVDAGRDRSLTNVRHDRSQIVGNPHLPSDRSRGEKIAQWFNPDAFALAAVGSLRQLRAQQPARARPDQHGHLAPQAVPDQRGPLRRLPGGLLQPAEPSELRHSSQRQRYGPPLGAHHGCACRAHRPVLAQVLVLARGLLESERSSPLERTGGEGLPAVAIDLDVADLPPSPMESCTCPLTTRVIAPALPAVNCRRSRARNVRRLPACRIAS